MPRIRTTFGLYFLIMVLVIAACKGDDGDKNGSDNGQPDTSATTVGSGQPDEIGDGSIFSDFDEADVPFSEPVIIKNGLTLLSSNFFVQDDFVYVMYVVRNDNDETIGNIHFRLVIIDEDRLPLENFSFSSPYNNIPPGQVIAVGDRFYMNERWAEYYDGVAAAITAEGDPLEAYAAHFETNEDTELDAGNNKVQGSTTNVGSDPLTLVTATFALYDENDEIVAVIPAIPISGVDDQGYWQPGVTINFEADVLAVADGDLSVVSEIQLIIAGYALDF